MAFIENKEELKKHFIKGDLPTEEHFANLIDAFVHKRHEKNDNIGFGTDNPNNTLDINGNMVIGSQYAGQEIAPDDGLLVEGKVGVGVDTPEEKIHVDGNIRIDTGGLMIGDEIIITPERKWIGDNTGLKGEDGKDGKDGEDGKDGTSGTSLWNDDTGKVTTTVKVGIGAKASDPTTTLEVDGYVTKKQVGFTVGTGIIDADTGKIEFSKVISNVVPDADGWDKGSSEFVAPISGVYFFTASVIVSDNGKDGKNTISLVKEGDQQIDIWNSDNHHEIGIASLLISLLSKDKIWINTSIKSNSDGIRIKTINFSGYRL